MPGGSERYSRQRGEMGLMEAKTRFWGLRHLKGTPEAGAMVHSSNQLRQLGRNLRDQGQ